MTKEKLRRLLDLVYLSAEEPPYGLTTGDREELAALKAEFEAWEPEAAERRLRSALVVVADQLARWLHLPTGTRLADLREFVDDALMADWESKG